MDLLEESHATVEECGATIEGMSCYFEPGERMLCYFRLMRKCGANLDLRECGTTLCFTTTMCFYRPSETTSI